MEDSLRWTGLDSPCTGDSRLAISTGVIPHQCQMDLGLDWSAKPWWSSDNVMDYLQNWSLAAVESADCAQTPAAPQTAEKTNQSHSQITAVRHTAVASQERLSSHQTTLQCLFWVQKCSEISQQVALISQDAAELPKKWHDFLSLSQLLKVMQEGHKILHLHRIVLQSLTHLETQYSIMFTPASHYVTQNQDRHSHTTRVGGTGTYSASPVHSWMLMCSLLLYVYIPQSQHIL